MAPHPLFTAPDPTATPTAERVLREQVAALYKSHLTSTIAGTLLACAISGFIYWKLRDPWALAWLALVFADLLRYPLSQPYHNDPRARENSDYWAKFRDQEFLLYSIMWGLAPWMYMPQDDIPLTVLMMLIILGLSSGGVPAVAHRWETTLRFVVPMVGSLIVALAWRGDVVHLFLAACTFVYLGATLHFASLQHKLLTEALLNRFEKEALAEELREQMAITAKASKDKTHFFAAASHDLRQPLHAIALFGAVLQQELKGHPAHANAKRLMRAVHALSASLDIMLDISRLDAGVIEPHKCDMPLNPLLQSLNQMFASRAEERGLQLRVRASTLWIHSDSELLHRMLANLVENAIKYTGHGGVLVIARQRGTETWIDVCDTGIGITDEQQERVFDEFYQAHNPGRDRSQGLGIGLSIVRRLSALLQHPVQVRSRPGHGSRFRVTVPTATANTSPQGHAHPQQTPQPRQAGALPRTVLLIDDEADIGDAISALLNSYGIDVLVARDEQTARRMLSDRKRPFDALLCDYRLAAGEDGLAVAQRLRAQFDPKLPLLMITGETAPERLQTLRNAGVPVLFKPAPASMLLRALQDLISPSTRGPAAPAITTSSARHDQTDICHSTSSESAAVRPKA